MADKDQPQQETHYAYSVIKREGKSDYWMNIGIVFPHKDGKGFNIMLQAIPFDQKIVLREVSEDKSARDQSSSRDAEDEKTRQAVRQTNDRRRGR
jgi:hypothetical protein